MKKKGVLGVLWEVDVCGSAIDLVHGSFETIKELNIPSLSISINMAHDDIHCFKCPSQHDRYHKVMEIGKEARNLKSFTVPDDVVKAAKSFLKAQDTLEKETSKYLLN